MSTDEISKLNLLVAANAIELGKQVIMHVVGDDIAPTIDGKPLDDNTVTDFLAAKLNTKLSPIGNFI